MIAWLLLKQVAGRCKAVKPVPFDWPVVFEHHAQRFAIMARNPAWRAYAKSRVEEMESEQGGHWVGLLARVREILAGDAK